jgi:diacylglycerol kinase (ATP)
MRIQVIVNQQCEAGKRDNLLTVLKNKFNHCLAALDETRSSHHATDIACQAAGDHIDTIAVVGGDGTVNAVLNGIVGTDVALGVIPAGTANDLASLYEVPTSVSEACDVILERHIKRADAISVNGRSYVTTGGLGFPCTIASAANAAKLHAKSGSATRCILGARFYLLVTLYQSLRKISSPNPVRVYWNDHWTTLNPIALFVSNQPFLGKHFLISPKAVNDDGMFDICIIESLPGRAQILSMILKTLHGHHLRSPHVKIGRVANLLLETEEPTMFFGDGEVFGSASEFRIKILPRAVRIITPSPNPLEGSC